MDPQSFILPLPARRTTPPTGNGPEYGFVIQSRLRPSSAAGRILQESDDVYSFEIACITSKIKDCRSNVIEESENAAPKLDYIPNGVQGYVRYKCHLTEHEKFEIKPFREVHYVAPRVKKTEPVPGSENNDGFDDEDGCYKCIMGDHLYYRYEMISKLGAGVFGTVYKAHDHKLKRNVAVKILKNTTRIKKIGDDEIAILKELGKLDHSAEKRMTHLIGSFTFRQHSCLVFDLCAMNVYALIKNNSHKGLSLPIVRKFAIGLLRFLSFIHSRGVMYCDLKPENILLKSPTRTGLQVCDFNISCHEERQMYAYIQSRFYRAPEVMLQYLQPYGSKYSRAIDMWSFGCVIAEFFLGTPLFPGQSGKDQIAVILEGLGMPPQDYMELCSETKKKDYFPNGVPFYCQSATEGGYPDTNKKYFRLPPGGKPIGQTLKNAGPRFVDFLRQILKWHPEERMTADMALSHSWITSSLSVDSGTSALTGILNGSQLYRSERLG